MRKLSKAGVAVVCAAAMLGATGCAGAPAPGPSHEHTFASTWTQTVTEHYKKATCGHSGEKSESAAHTFGTGDKSYECTVCGYKKPVPHEHTYATEYTVTHIGHYRAATCEHEGERTDVGYHDWRETGGVYECTVCGYTKSLPDDTDVWVSEIDVSLDKDTVVVGETATATAAISVDHNSPLDGYVVDGKWYEYEFESSDENIATVSETGEVTALAIGNVSIIARSKQDPTMFAGKQLSILGKTVFEAEAETTRLVGYSAADVVENDEFGYVKAAAPKRVQSDRYNAKYNNSQIIFGVVSDTQCRVSEITVTYASPYGAGQDQTAAKPSDLGTLYINGAAVALPDTALTVGANGNDEIFNDITVTGDFVLYKGMNRIIWEAENKSGVEYEYLGGLDKISIVAPVVLTAYKVMWWTDRNVYYDVAGGEPINVYLEDNYADAHSDSWLAVYGGNGMTFAPNAGLYGYAANTSSRYWAWTQPGENELTPGNSVNILDYRPHNDGEGLWGGYDGSTIYLAYFLYDDHGAAYDFAGITCYRTPDNSKYGGYSNIKTVAFEAEAETTRLVGYSAADVSADGYVTSVAPTRVDADKYTAKYNNSQLIFGVISDSATAVKVKLDCVAPGDASSCDVYVNGVLAEFGSDGYAVSSLYNGANRVVVEPKAAGVKIDKIELEVAKTVALTAYKVMWWTDRNVYYDVAGGEPINVYLEDNYADAHSDSWLGVFNGTSVNFASPDGTYGYSYSSPSRYWAWTQPGENELTPGGSVNILDYRPHNDGEGLWGGADGNTITIAYLVEDTRNAIYDFVQITCYRDSDVSKYGGVRAAD